MSKLECAPNDQQALLLTLPSGRRPSIRGVWLDRPGVYGALTMGTSAYAATSSHFAVRQPVPHSLYSSMCGRALIVRKYSVYSLWPQEQRDARPLQWRSKRVYRNQMYRDRTMMQVQMRSTLSQTYSAFAKPSEGFCKMRFSCISFACVSAVPFGANSISLSAGTALNFAPVHTPCEVF